MRNTVRASFLTLMLCALTLIPSAWPKQTAPSFEIQPMSSDLLDVGCALFHRKSDWVDPLFINNVQGIWIHLNGQQITLTRVEEDTDTATDWEKFAAPDVQVLVKYGRGRQNEAGATYKRAIMKVTYKGQTRILPVKGSCGC